MENSRGEPMLARSPLSPSATKESMPKQHYTPLRYFLASSNDFHDNDDDGDPENDEEDNYEELNDFVVALDESTPVDPEQQIQVDTLRLLGTPYVRHWDFWYRVWPISALLGGLLGMGTVIFFGLYQGMVDHLWYLSDNEPPRADWTWILVTSMGGFACGLLLLNPSAPNVGAIRTMFHDAIDLKGNAKEAPWVVLSCWICLVTGAPLGPEMALGAMGSGLAAGLATWWKNLPERTRAAWVQCGMAGSLGGLFSTPLLGLLLVHELSVVGRPQGTTWTHLVSTSGAEPSSLFKATNTGDHDFMEQVSLMGTAAVAAYIVLHLLVPNDCLPPTNIVIDNGSDQFALWHLAAALPIGVLCGMVGSLSLILNGTFRTIRVKSCNVMHETMGLPKWVGPLLFPTLAGVLHGLLTMWNPWLVGSGSQFVMDLKNAEDDGLEPGWLVVTALGKMASTSMCLGFGLVGGPLFSMAFVGLCIGLSASSVLPLSLVVPCCMCATVGSFVPIPFTLVVCVSIVFSLSPEQMGPLLVATFVAYSLTGGIGVIRKLGEQRLEDPSVDQDRDQSLGEHDENMPRSDCDILRGVRCTIFGKA